MRRLSLALLAPVVWAGCSPPAPPAVDPSAYPETLDLTAGRLPVLVRTATRTLDMGTPEARGHLLDGWSNDEQLEDGTTFVWGIGPTSTLRFEIVEPSDLVLRIRAWTYREPDSPRQDIHLQLNGKPLAKRRLRPGLRELEVDLPVSDQVAGANVLAAHYSWYRSSSPSSRGREAVETRALAVAWDELTLGEELSQRRENPGVESGILHLPPDTEISFFVPPGDSALFSFDLEPSDRRARLRIRARGEGDEVPSVREVDAEGPGTVLLDLDPERLTRITLGNGRISEGGITVRQPTLRGRRPFVVPAAWSGPSGPSEDPPTGVAAGGDSRPNVIIYMVDTLRADHLGCYGYGRRTSPEIDAFAADAVLFERTMAQSSWTRSTIASLLTGAVPPVHGIVDRSDALPQEALTLAEILAQAGYSTAAFVTNGNVGEAFGFDQGFSHLAAR